MATRIGSFIQCPQLRIATSVAQKPTKAFICMHHKNIPESKFENYIQFVNSFIFNDSIPVITDFPYHSKYKLRNNIANFLFRIVFNNISIKGLGSEEKYWTIVKAMQGHNAVSVFPDREGQQYFGDTSNFFRDGVFAASILLQIPILNYSIVEKTPADNFSDIFIDQFEPPKLDPFNGVLFNEKNTVNSANEYSKWRLKHFELITKFTLECEAKHRAKIFQLESKKASCTLNQFEVCKPNVDKEKLIARNNLLKELRFECYAELKN